MYNSYNMLHLKFRLEESTKTNILSISKCAVTGSFIRVVLNVVKLIYGNVIFV